MILDYENYDGELVRHRHTSSPLGSTGDSSLSSFHDETYQETLTVTGEPGDMPGQKGFARLTKQCQPAAQFNSQFNLFR